MPRTALSLFGLFVLLAVCLRAALHRQQTGSFGLRLPRGRRVTREWVVVALLVGSFSLVGVVAPLLHLARAIEPVPALAGSGVRCFGLACSAIGLLIVLGSQLWMGRSWCMGVDPLERTALVTGGPFAVVRNPIFTGVVVMAVGLTALEPSAMALGGLALVVAAVEAQVRWIEEPHLRAVHGNAYAAYAARTGRFAPGLGRHPASPA